MSKYFSNDISTNKNGRFNIVKQWFLKNIFKMTRSPPYTHSTPVDLISYKVLGTLCNLRYLILESFYLPAASEYFPLISVHLQF